MRHRSWHITLVVLAWSVVRLWSPTAAVLMSIVAATVGSLGSFDDLAPRAGDAEWTST